jgi:hypothetical protein
LSLWLIPKILYKNFFNDIIQREPNYLLPQPSNSRIPQGTRQLLGLNLKYCLASSQLQNIINTTVQKMAYAIRTKYNLQALNKEDDSDYIKQIYIKNKTWNPEPAPLHIEDKITDFEKLLKHQQNNLSNLL